jgi:hypothetical protein
MSAMIAVSFILCVSLIACVRPYVAGATREVRKKTGKLGVLGAGPQRQASAGSGPFVPSPSRLPSETRRPATGTPEDWPLFSLRVFSL